MNNLFIILASGKSKRFKSKTPKQFNIYKNKPIYAHSIDKALKSKLFSKIILVTNSLNRIKIKDKNLIIIKGGIAEGGGNRAGQWHAGRLRVLGEMPE